MLKAEKTYVVTTYIEINGKSATVFKNKFDAASQVDNNYNAQVAYILNKQQGYGKAAWCHS